jgi:hypothetical protein
MSLQVDGPDATPLSVQVLQNQTPVASLRSGLAAQQHRGNVEEVSVQRFLDATIAQEIQKRPLVVSPSAAVSVGAQDLRRRGEPRFVDVLRATELLQEEREVGATGEAGQSGGVVQAHVEEALDAGAF